MLPQSQTIGHPFIELQQVDSTNNYAIGLLHAGMTQHGTAVLAHHQTKGKGQRTKAWEAQAGENITTSIILHPNDLTLRNAFLLSMAIAVGVQRFFHNYADGEVSVKWPNDLYWRDRKAGGILIENILQGATWKSAVVGIGININQTDFSHLSEKAVSLKQITGKTYPIVDLAIALYAEIEQSLLQLNRDKDSIIDDYHSVLFKRFQHVRLKKENRIFEALVKGVSNEGELIVDCGVEERFGVGEVEWML